jgi:hypothetical protein
MSRLALAATLHIYPNRLALEQARAPTPGETVITDSAVTFGQLVMLLPPRAPLPSLSMARGHLLVRSLLASGPAALKSRAKDPHAVRATCKAMLELRRAGIAPQHLRGSRLLPAVQHLCRLLGDYESALKSIGCMDLADREREAVLQAATGNLPSIFAKAHRVIVEGGTLLFGSRLDLLNALAARGLRVLVRIPYDHSRSEAFAFPEAALAVLEARAHPNIEVDYDSRIGTGPLAPLRGAQFTSRSVQDAPAKVWACTGPADQARAVAEQVLIWLQQGIASDDIAVVTPDLKVTGKRLAAEIEALGVRAHRRCGPDVASSPAARLIQLTLDLMERGIPREELIEILSIEEYRRATPLGEFGAGRLWSELKRTGARFMLSQDLGESLIRQAKLRDRGDEQGARTQTAKMLSTDIHAVIDRLSAIPKEAPLRQMLAGLTQAASMVWAENTSLEPRLSLLAKGESQGQVLRRCGENAKVGRAFVDLINDLDRAAAQLPIGPDFDRNELAQTLRALGADAALVPEGLRGGAVGVFSPDQVVEAHFGRVIFAGVDAGTFPERVSPDRVLGEDVRSQINSIAGPRLLQSAPTTGRGALARSARDFWLYLEVLASAKDELITTFCAASGQSALDRSPVVDELLRSLYPRALQAVGPSRGRRPIGSIRSLLECAAGALAVLTPDAMTYSATMSRAAAEVLGSEIGQRLENLSRRATASRLLSSDAHVAAPLSPSAREQIRTLLTQKVQSVSHLDLLATCRFRFFAGALLSLERVTGRGLAASAREHGAAAHKALELMYRDIKARGGLRKVRSDPAASLARAREIVFANRDDILAQAVIHPALAEPALEAAFLAVKTQLELDARRTEDFEPVALEYRFDDRPLGEAPPLFIESPKGELNLRVRGSIDRIDACAESVLILDYKRTVIKRSAGRHLQLPLYAAVAARDFGEKRRDLGAAWVDFRQQKLVHTPEPLTTVDDLQAQLKESLWDRLASVLGGSVVPDPEPVELCKHCDFSALCRIGAEKGDDESE